MYKQKLDRVIEDSDGILKEHNLCDYCLGRMFAGRLGILSHKRLGSKIRKKINRKETTSCYICKNLMSNLNIYLDKMIAISDDYQFSTFLVGAILKPSVLDRDDAVRSNFKLKGIISIKSAVTREMGKLFSHTTRARVDYDNPDLTFTIDFKNEQCDIRSRPLLLQGRYTKKVRGLQQKQKTCENCDGKGCFSCSFHGIREFNSVEGKISKFLIEKFGCMLTTITWIGSEDESSLVLGTGRPFFVKMTDPHKRRVSLRKNIEIDGVSIHGLRTILKIPSEPVKFHTLVSIEIEAENDIAPDKLMNVTKLKGKEILISENLRHKNRKKIYDIKVERKSKKSIKILMTSDGGIPLKRFVSGKKTDPSISSIIETPCNCKIFDFYKIIVI